MALFSDIKPHPLELQKRLVGPLTEEGRKQITEKFYGMKFPATELRAPTELEKVAPRLPPVPKPFITKDAIGKLSALLSRPTLEEIQPSLKEQEKAAMRIGLKRFTGKPVSPLEKRIEQEAGTREMTEAIGLMAGQPEMKAVSAGKKVIGKIEDFFVKQFDSKGNIVFEKIKAKPVPIIEGLETFIHKDIKTGKNWVVSEARTGKAITSEGGMKTRADAIDNAKANIEKYGMERVKNIIEGDIKRTGLSPRYSQKTKPTLKGILEKGKPSVSLTTEQVVQTKGKPKTLKEILQPKIPQLEQPSLPEGVKLPSGGIVPPVPPSPPIKTIISFPEGDPVQKVIQVLKEAKPIRGRQETLYSKERARRLARAMGVGEKISGEKGFYAQLGQLKGELPKVEFEAIRNKIGQQDIDDLFQKIETNPAISGFEKITAKGGLAKLFGEMGGRVPTEGELILLNRVFPKELINTLLEKRPLWDKVKEWGLQIANVPRSLMSSFGDLSFGLRQGAFAAPRNIKPFWDSWKKQFRWFASEKAFQENQKLISQNPYFELAKESKLAFTEMDSIMGLREERYASQLAERIPVLGKVVRATGRAYTAFANKFRMDIFSSMVKDAERLGLNPKENIDLAMEIGRFVNNATGRGSLGGLERAATALNAFFFSPRLMASRLSLLNPIYYIRATPLVRKEALKSLFTFAGTAMTILGAAKLAGADVETDPRNSDFAKIKIGNTRIDILGGFQQYIRSAAQLISGKYISSTTGKEYTLGEGYKPLTRFDILLRQIESKEAPIASFITDILRQQDYAGEPVSVIKEIGQRLTPMIIGDIYDLAKDDPSLIPLSLLGTFGLGLQTYTPTKAKKKGGLFSNIKPK